MNKLKKKTFKKCEDYKKGDFLPYVMSLTIVGAAEYVGIDARMLMAIIFREGGRQGQKTFYEAVDYLSLLRDSASIGVGQITKRRFDETVANHPELGMFGFTDLVENDELSILVAAYHIKDIQDGLEANKANFKGAAKGKSLEYMTAYAYNMGPDVAIENAKSGTLAGKKSDNTGTYYADIVMGHYDAADHFLCGSEYWTCS